ncbi:MAG: CehA/McbA family metallohydrolase [Planctomycetota bacterium]|nr:CehA/McbA family metallohydrolase [Planctomycetota bacterium]
MRIRLVLAVGALGLLAAASLQDTRPGRVLDAKLHHLGDDRTPEWSEAPADPEGRRLDLDFEASTHATDWMLYVRQRSIDNVWRLVVNDVEVARLTTGAELVERWYSLQAGTLRAGKNRISFVPDTPTDDVVIGDVRLVERSAREVFDLQKLSLRVVDGSDASPLPARVTLVGQGGTKPMLLFATGAATATRDGVLYLDGEATVELPRGTYACFATRGSEWSLANAAVTVGATPASLEFALRREVDTAGFVAADTHLHTLQFSGHGDASALERQVTLAGEGVELAIATDHNHQTDYGIFQRELGLQRWFTPVVGNEVTTDIGHFNGFPFDPAMPRAPFRSRDIITIVQGMRELGAQVVILNHPRWPSATDSPFGHHHLDRLLGRFDPPLELPVDATELVNSTTEELDGLALFRDWFALLNRGVRIFAVGSSDSHTVAEPVGQGRTWVPSATDDAAAIDVNASCAAIREGRTSIGMGIFVTALVEGRPAMGLTFDRSSNLAPFAFDLRVQAPGWIHPRKVTVFANGRAEAKFELERTEGRAFDRTLRVEVPLAARNDAWIVAVVEGEAIDTPAWPSLNKYTLAATNPLFIDRDGNGYTSPGSAASAFAPKATDETIAARMPELDGAHVVQFAAAWLATLRARGVERAAAVERLKKALGPKATKDAEVAELLARELR